jgi:hypothetical protein
MEENKKKNPENKEASFSAGKTDPVNATPVPDLRDLDRHEGSMNNGRLGGNFDELETEENDLSKDVPA